MFRLFVTTVLLYSVALAQSSSQPQEPSASGPQTSSTPARTQLQPAPEPTPTSQEYDAVLGVGSLITGTDDSDYTTNSTSNVLQSTQLGRATPQFLAGVGFVLPFPKVRHFGNVRRPWDAFLSLKFAPSSSQAFSGYVLGGTYSLTHVFSILCGFSLTPFNETSPGFRVAAAQVVAQNQNVPFYQRYNPNDLLQNKPNAFDGFPLFVQGPTGPTTTQVFPGSPTTIHYHGGVVIGVSVSASLKGLFTGGKQETPPADTPQAAPMNARNRSGVLADRH
jgi:hypothetical protein